MGVLRNFESRLERGIEGFFTRAFRSGLHPIELAKRILREMDAHKTVGVKEVWVPNRYILRMSEEDRARFENMEGALARELETVVTEGARERGWGLVARPEVAFETVEKMKRGDLKIVTELTEETGPPPPEAPRPTPAPEPAAPAPGGPARLVLDGREVTLDRDRMVIGRLHGSEIEIEDPGASRRHAEIRKEGDRFVLVDLGSTNGTLVNDSPVAEHALQDGDRITIGRTVLEFRRG
jgi:Protein of unknown function (DUF3662)/FHA domain